MPSFRGLVLCVFGVLGSTSLTHRAAAQVRVPVSGASADAPEESITSLADSLQGDAKHDYELGRLLYDNADYAGALLRFESARRASGDPRLFWNAAVCEKAQRHYANAAALMRAFAASNSANVNEASRQSASAFIAAAESLTVPLEVSANVPGADVAVDAYPVGRMPLTAARIDWGPHQISVKRDGYFEYTQTIVVGSSAVVRVAAVLRALPHEGRIVVRAGPNQAISIDRHQVGYGNWEGVLVSGRHSLRVAGEGFVPYQRQILISDARTQGFDIALERAKPTLPSWVWWVGGGVLAAGAAAASYFVLRPDASHPTQGSLGLVQLQLH